MDHHNHTCNNTGFVIDNTQIRNEYLTEMYIKIKYKYDGKMQTLIFFCWDIYIYINDDAFCNVRSSNK